jgi:chromosome partitioning protein
MIIAITNQKGGVAKTTSTIALGGILAEQGKTLVVDIDPQANLTKGLGITVEPDQPTIRELLIEPSVSAADVIVEVSKGLFILPAPSEKGLAAAEAHFVMQAVKGMDCSRILKKKLRSIREKFDQILVDSPPNVGLLTINALMAADAVLIPVQCQFFALDGLGEILKTIAELQDEDIHPTLKVLGVLPTMADNTLTTKDALTTLETQLPESITIFDAVRRSVKFPESNLARLPIHKYVRGSEQSLADPYRQIAAAITKQLVGRA